MNGPSNLKVHEAVLYGGTQERIVWVYGTLGSNGGSSIKLGGQTVDLRAQVQDSLATPGSLSVNGKATYRVATNAVPQKLSVTRDTAGMFQVAPQNGATIAAVYYTDGTNWLKLNGTAGRVSATPVPGLNGAGQLTDAEAVAVSQALRGQGQLAVAVLNDPEAGLKVEPTPTESLRTSLYILPGVQTVAATTTGTVTTTPSTITPSTTPSDTPAGGRVNFTELASGTNATATTPLVQVATTQAQVASIYATAYGRQSSSSAAPALGRNQTLVAVFMGQRNSGGYSVKVTGTTVQNGVLTVTVTTTAPKAGTLTTMALTSPWTIVSVEGHFTGVNLVDTSGQLNLR